MPQVQWETLADFTGGLNLRADAFQLARNESPELMNVDVDPRGGFRLRGGVAPWGADADGEVRALLPFKTTSSAFQVVAQVGNGFKWSTGGAWSAAGALTRTGLARSTVFKDRLYIVTGADGDVIRWDGSSATAIAVPAYNENIEAPTTAGDGKMPRAKCIATHMGSVFAGNITEGATAHPNRVRWSHPNFPEDWRALDFIDIDVGHDGDEITALVPFGDRLLVFKRRSIHAIYGAPPEGLQVFPVSAEVGAPSQEAVVATDIGIYFYSVPEGVFLYQGKEPRYQFERLAPATRDGSLTAANAQSVRLGWGNRRLWLSVPWEGGGALDRVFVLDPELGKNGAWVAYDLAVGPFLEWNPPGGATQFLAGAVGRTTVVSLDNANQSFDDWGAGAEHIESYYRTRWVDLGAPLMSKRWKRPQVVLQSGSNSVVEVEAFSDYDPTTIRRRFNLTTAADTSRMVWGQPWGSARWARSGDGRNEVERGAPLGNGRAIALLFKGPQTNHRWGVDACSFTYLKKRVR